MFHMRRQQVQFGRVAVHGTVFLDCVQMNQIQWGLLDVNWTKLLEPVSNQKPVVARSTSTSFEHDEFANQRYFGLEYFQICKRRTCSIYKL